MKMLLGRRHVEHATSLIEKTLFLCSFLLRFTLMKLNFSSVQFKSDLRVVAKAITSGEASWPF